LNNTVFFGGDFHISECIDVPLYNIDNKIYTSNNNGILIGSMKSIISSGITHGQRTYGKFEINKTNITYYIIRSQDHRIKSTYTWDILENNGNKYLDNFTSL
jgi:hypothetical protein